MRILLIEDDNDKSGKIQNYLKEELEDCIIEERRSLRSGLKELISNWQNYSIVLMDMSMPNYDISLTEPEGGTHENFAGRDLLSQMALRKIHIPVLIITQYDTFGDSFNKLSLDELKQQMANSYNSIYKATVYYNSAQDHWKKELIKNISMIMDEKNNG